MTNSTIGRPTGGEGAPAAGGQLITVQVKGQRFALNVMAVREIRGWTPSTHLPHAPSYILGMVNLRGVVLVVIDGRDCTIEVCDEGHGFSHPPPAPPGTLIDPDAEHGRGVQLMRALVDRLDFTAGDDRGTIVRLHKTLTYTSTSV